jgi:hypothetical protein
MSYVLAGYGVTVLTLAGYTLRVIRRGRALARTLPPEKQWQ